MNAQNQLIAAAMGAFVSLSISAIKQCRWDRRVKFALSVVLCVVVGAMQVALSGQLTAHDFVTTVGLVFTAATVTYQAVLKGTGLDNTLESIGDTPEPSERGL